MEQREYEELQRMAAEVKRNVEQGTSISSYFGNFGVPRSVVPSQDRSTYGAPTAQQTIDTIGDRHCGSSSESVQVVSVTSDVVLADKSVR